MFLSATNCTGYEVRCDLLIVGVDGGEVVTLPVLLSRAGNLIRVTGGGEGFPTRPPADRKIVPTEHPLSTLKGASPTRICVQLTPGG